MSIFTDDDDKTPTLYITPDSMQESVDLQKFAAHQQPLTVEIKSDEDEHIFHLELKRMKGV